MLTSKEYAILQELLVEPHSKTYDLHDMLELRFGLKEAFYKAQLNEFLDQTADENTAAELYSKRTWTVTYNGKSVEIPDGLRIHDIMVEALIEIQKGV